MRGFAWVLSGMVFRLFLEFGRLCVFRREFFVFFFE